MEIFNNTRSAAIQEIDFKRLITNEKIVFNQNFLKMFELSKLKKFIMEIS